MYYEVYFPNAKKHLQEGCRQKQSVDGGSCNASGYFFIYILYIYVYSKEQGQTDWHNDIDIRLLLHIYFTLIKLPPVSNLSQVINKNILKVYYGKFISYTCSNNINYSSFQLGRFCNILEYMTKRQSGFCGDPINDFENSTL